MEELLAKYQDELVRIRRLCREFSERYPRLAGKLQMSGEVCEDPHVERLIEASALIAARVSKRLDDDYPQFTEGLMEVLFPHYLRPFPSCSIVRLDTTVTKGKEVNGTWTIPRGTVLESAPVNGVKCRFTTAYGMTIAPVLVTDARFDSLIKAPANLRLPRNASSEIQLVVETRSPSIELASLNMERIRVFMDGEPSFCAALRDALFMRTVSAFVEDEDGRWIELGTVPILPVGFEEDDALIPFGARSHPAYRLLIEFFSFPEKFNFFDIDLKAILARLPASSSRIVLHLAVAGLRPDSNTTRLLQSLSEENLVLFCSPVINLFTQPAVPIQVNHLTTDYPVIASSAHANCYEVYSINSVHMLHQSGSESVLSEFRPFYSLRHGEGEATKGRYWVIRRDEVISENSPGHERMITLVDIGGSPLALDKQSLSVEISCTNRDLPTMLGFGRRDGDFVALPIAGGFPIRFMRRPTQTQRFESGRGLQWRLISHLSLNQRSLSEQGLAGFQEMLTLNDMQRSPVSLRQLAGVVGMDRAETSTWRRCSKGVSLVHGIEIRLTLDEDAFVGNSMHLFVQVIDHFLDQYVQLNSFVELVVISHRSGEELIRCEPRKGSLSPA
jgi:type VI secretion system protein ImpG